MSKGHAVRLRKVSQTDWDLSYDRIFGNKGEALPAGKCCGKCARFVLCLAQFGVDPDFIHCISTTSKFEEK